MYPSAASAAAAPIATGIGRPKIFFLALPFGGVAGVATVGSDMPTAYSAGLAPFGTMNTRSPRRMILTFAPCLSAVVLAIVQNTDVLPSKSSPCLSSQVPLSNHFAHG